MNCKDFNREYGSLYKYVSAPPIPGVRRLACAPEQKYRLTANLNKTDYNFIPSHHASYNAKNCYVPVYSAQGVYDPETLEGFGGNMPSGLKKLLQCIICILIILMIIYLLRKESNPAYKTNFLV